MVISEGYIIYTYIYITIVRSTLFVLNRSTFTYIWQRLCVRVSNAMSSLLSAVDELIEALDLKKDGNGNWLFNSQSAFALQFVFPQMFNRALKILESTDGVSRHVVFGSVESSLLAVEDGDGSSKRLLVDLEQWFCSCRPYLEQFGAAATMVDAGDSSSEKLSTIKHRRYGSRCPSLSQFLLQSPPTPPVCEHLLAAYLLQQNGYTTPVHRHAAESWLALHASFME